MWLEGLPPLEKPAQQQLEALASLEVVHPRGVAVMPDAHWGMGALVGSVIPTKHAVIPAAVGVDIGCGMMAARTSLRASDLPDSLKEVRVAVESRIPHGRTSGGNPDEDFGGWYREVPDRVQKRFKNELLEGFKKIVSKHPKVERGNLDSHLGTLGTGNHFVELCLDEKDRVWMMLHSGSRGVGNRLGMYFIELAKKEMEKLDSRLPDEDLAYLKEGTQYFDDYFDAVMWAQEFARVNRELMMDQFIDALRDPRLRLPKFSIDKTAINCHHNYVSREVHFGESMLITRKGAVSAKKGELGIIPGSMGTRSYIVRGKGNPDSYCTCSHGAGRLYSRSEAKRRFTLDQHIEATSGIECRTDAAVIDETPLAYKDIEAVMKAQEDIVEIVHTLRQVLCVKG